MKRWMGGGIVAAVIALVACSGGDAKPAGSSDDPAKVTEQTQFDFTVDYDRAWFTAEDLVYRQSVGPYAAYEVTGPAPRLRGPRVQFGSESAYAMLCGAEHYFAGGADEAPTMKIALVAGEKEQALIKVEVPPSDEGDCSDAKDDFGEDTPLPPDDDGGEGGGSGAGGASGEGGGNGEGGTVVFEPPKRVVKLGLSFDEAPPVGSIVLVRRVGLFLDPPGHNGSHAIPKICCEGGDCGLGEPPK